MIKNLTVGKDYEVRAAGVLVEQHGNRELLGEFSPLYDVFMMKDCDKGIQLPVSKTQTKINFTLIAGSICAGIALMCTFLALIMWR